MLKKIKEKLHKILFPSQAREIDFLSEQVDFLESVIETEPTQKTPAPNMADLMRDSLKLITVDFVHQEKGVPNDFLNTSDDESGKELRKMYIGQLYQIQQMEVWKAMTQNMIDIQGNYTLRVAPTDMEVFAGRMMIGGISLVMEKVKQGYDEYMEGSKSPEEFDATDHSTEGIPYTEGE